jgi:catalase (peroxidase I)
MNRDWGPNQLNLQVLRQYSSLSNPIDEAFELRALTEVYAWADSKQKFVNDSSWREPRS